MSAGKKAAVTRHAKKAVKRVKSTATRTANKAVKSVKSTARSAVRKFTGQTTRTRAAKKSAGALGPAYPRVEHDAASDDPVLTRR